MPYDSVKQQMIQGVASGTGPDLMRMDIIWTTEFAELAPWWRWMTFPALRDEGHPV